MVATHGQKHIPHAFPIHLSTEAGMFGGFPSGGARWGHMELHLDLLDCKLADGILFFVRLWL